MNTVNPASNEKEYLRDYFKEKRAQLCEDLSRKEALDAEIQTRLIISPEYRAAESVLIYMARPDEISTSLIIHAALANNKTVALPVCNADKSMTFRQIRDIVDLKPGSFGILEPDESCPVITPGESSLCVCPGLCCDMRGFRLGFGGGYYDRFLADFKGVKAALCYSDSVIPAIAADKYDVRMNVIHTDSFTRYIKD